MRFLLIASAVAVVLMGCAGKFERSVRGTWKVQKIDRKLYVNHNFNDVQHLQVDGTITFNKKDGNYDLTIDLENEAAAFEWSGVKDGEEWTLTINPGKWTKVFGTPPVTITVTEWSDNTMMWRFVDTSYFKNNAAYQWEQEWQLTKQ